jgi:uroporphyrinogen decarboxylase
MIMTPREVMLAQIDHRETTPVPYTLGFEGDVADRLDAHYGGKQWRQRIQPFIHSTDIVNHFQRAPTDRPGYERDLYGSLWRMDQRPFHLASLALPTPSFDGYRWPAPESFYVESARVVEAKRLCAEAKGESYLIAGLGWGLFETSWGMRGFENVLMDVVAEPDFYAALLDRVTEQFVGFVDYTCRTLPEVDAIMFGDDWGDQRGVIVGPERWRALFKPRYARIYAAVHAHGKRVISHCCGSIVDILPDVIEIGLDVLESCQPEARDMNPYELKRRWGDKIVFWGGLGSESTIPFGTPAQIRTEVRRLCREMGRGGGYILAPAKGLQPETPTANAVAVVEAFTNQG